MDKSKRQVFVSYAYKDEVYAKPFIDGLKKYAPFLNISFWNDTEIFTGEKWHAAIQKELAKADFAVKKTSLKIKFLHISDLHFKDTKQTSEIVNAGIVTSSLVRKIEKLRRDGEVFDFIIITGDLAFSGKKAEYLAAEEFIGKLLTSSGLENHFLFLVPGNHDLNQQVIDSSHLKCYYSFSTEEDITDLITSKDSFPVWMRKFENFNAFANKMMGSVYFNGSSLFLYGTGSDEQKWR